MNKAAHTLVIGGARSGKSGFAQRAAEARAAADDFELVFIATAHAYDDEMAARISAHVAARDARWRTVDAPYDLAEAVDAEARPGRLLLVDCLTLWLANHLLRGDDIESAGNALVTALASNRTPVMLVSNEVGWGIVPENALARRFRDAQGRLNQVVASACENVVLVAAGLPLVFKGTLPPM